MEQIVCTQSGHCIGTFFIVECTPNDDTLNNFSDAKDDKAHKTHCEKDIYANFIACHFSFFYNSKNNHNDTLI